jgi:hypothetical protein
LLDLDRVFFGQHPIGDVVREFEVFGACGRSVRNERCARTNEQHQRAQGTTEPPGGRAQAEAI